MSVQDEQWGPSSPGTQMCCLKILSLHNYSLTLEKYCQNQYVAVSMLRNLVSALNDILCFKKKLITMFKIPRNTILVQGVVGKKSRHVKF